MLRIRISQTRSISRSLVSVVGTMPLSTVRVATVTIGRLLLSLRILITLVTFTCIRPSRKPMVPTTAQTGSLFVVSRIPTVLKPIP